MERTTQVKEVNEKMISILVDARLKLQDDRKNGRNQKQKIMDELIRRLEKLEQEVDLEENP